MTSRAPLPHLGLGLSVDDPADVPPAIAQAVRFFEVTVDAALPDLEGVVLDDPFAPPPTVEEFYARVGPPSLAGRALPCVAHAPATGPLSAAELDHVARMVAARGATWLSTEAVGLSSGCALDPLPLPLSAAGVDETAARLAAAAARIPVPLLASSAPCASAVGELHCAEFLAAVAERSGAAIRIDLGHLLGYQVSRGHAADHRASSLPFDRIAAIAIAPGSIAHTRGVAHYRAGEATIAPELLALLALLVRRCPSLRAVALRVPADRDLAARAVDQTMRVLVAGGFQP